jgi:hypothetical protein
MKTFILGEFILSDVKRISANYPLAEFELFLIRWMKQNPSSMPLLNFFVAKVLAFLLKLGFVKGSVTPNTI